LSNSKYGLSSIAATVATIAAPFGGGTTIQMHSNDKAVTRQSNSTIAALCSNAVGESYGRESRALRCDEKNVAQSLRATTTTNGPVTRLHLIIHGRVQGIFFRGSALQLARELGLTGWVRNRLDGTVELVAEGDEAPLATLRAWCAKGPRGAVVRSMDVLDEAATGEFTSFGVRGEV
jgi:acylphosphatase